MHKNNIKLAIIKTPEIIQNIDHNVNVGFNLRKNKNIQHTHSIKVLEPALAAAPALAESALAAPALAAPALAAPALAVVQQAAILQSKTTEPIKIIDIFATCYIENIANALAKILKECGFFVNINIRSLINADIQKCNIYKDRFLFIFCPQILLQAKNGPVYPTGLLPLPPNKYFLYQLEQLDIYTNKHMNTNLIQLIKCSKHTFDYSEVNLPYYPVELREKISYLIPPVVCEILTESPIEKINDILFCGYSNPRREKILNELKSAGYNVLHVTDVFGPALTKLIKQSKIFLNIHHDNSKSLETSRLNEAVMAKDIHIISEKGDGDKLYAGRVIFVENVLDIISKVKTLLDDTNVSKNIIKFDDIFIKNRIILTLYEANIITNLIDHYIYRTDANANADTNANTNAITTTNIVLATDYYTKTRHQYGWKSVIINLIMNGLITSQKRIDERKGSYTNIIRLIDCMESFFIWDNKTIQQNWIGIVHYSPNLPRFIAHDLDYTLNNPNVINSLKYCKGIIALSTYSSNHIKRNINYKNIRVHTILHPISEIKEKFSLQHFLQRKRNINVVQLGLQDRIITTIYTLKTHYKKLWLPGTKKSVEKLLERETNFLNIKINLQEVNVEYIAKQYYEAFLKNNIIIIPLWSGSANNSILEIVEMNIPAFITRMPATEEYLGTNYPMFYSSIKEIEVIINNEENLYTLLNKTNEYLINSNKNDLSFSTFNKQLLNVCI